MSKDKLEIRYSMEQRINDHSIPKVTLYRNGKESYSAQYESCVIEHINENYAKKSLARLKKKFVRVAGRFDKLRAQADELEKTMSEPLVPVTGWRK